MKSPLLLGLALALSAAAQPVDHHQHIFSPTAAAHAKLATGQIIAADLISHLDNAGIHRAVVLSVAYGLANPNKPTFSNEYALVRAENDWTAAQVAQYPGRLTGFCSVNPLSSYALKEIDRCAKNPNLRTGLKLHFGNSDVDVDNPVHLTQLRRVFRAANRHHMAIAVHASANWDHNRPYGARQARVFLEQLLPEAPDVTIQIAHLAGGGGLNDPGAEEARDVYADAIAKHDPRMKHVWFDVSGLEIDNWKEVADRIAQRLRQLGLSRMLYGNDAPVPGNLPTEDFERWRQLPLTEAEFHLVETNVAPYLQP